MQRYLFILVFMVAVQICMAGEPLLVKSSPFNATANEQYRADPNRVNLWPFLYLRAQELSVLWPMFAANEEGHGVYPLYSIYYDKELSVLWPMSSLGIGPKAGTGSRILNTYWEDDFFTVFPQTFWKKDDFFLSLPVMGWGEDWYSVMPPFWIHWPKERSWFFAVPPTWLSRHQNSMEFASLPFFYRSVEPNASTLNVLPFYFSGGNTNHGHNVLLPCYMRTWDAAERTLLTPASYYEVNWKGRTLNIFPFYYSGGTTNHGHNALFPCYARTWNGADRSLLTPAFFNAQRGDWRTFNVFPFYYSNCGIDQGRELVLPLYQRRWSPTSSSLFTPFYYASAQPGRTSMGIMMMYHNGRWADGGYEAALPLFVRQWDATTRSLLTPFSYYKKTPAGNTLNVFPLYYSGSSSNAGHQAVFSLYAYSWRGESSSFYTMLYGQTRKPGGGSIYSPLFCMGRDYNERYVNSLGLLFHHSWDSGGDRSYTHVMWPMFSRERTRYGTEGFALGPMCQFEFREQSMSKFNIMPLFMYEWLRNRSEYPNSPNVETRRIESDLCVLPWIKIESGTVFQENKEVEIPEVLRRKTKEEYGMPFDFDAIYTYTNEWAAFARKRYQPHVYSACSFWPLWDRERTVGISSEFSILGWIYRDTWNNKDDQGFETASTRLLWRWLRYDRQNRDVTLDVFPFIAYDKTEKDAFSQFSLAWRLYRFEKKGDARKLHLFFIPITWTAGK